MLAHFSFDQIGFGPFIFGFLKIGTLFEACKYDFGPKKLGFGPKLKSKNGPRNSHF